MSAVGWGSAAVETCGPREFHCLAGNLMPFKQTFPNIVAEWNSDNIFTSVRNAIKKSASNEALFLYLTSNVSSLTSYF